ncbi:MAG: 16S rRNA processing protein RimM [Clostridia bacterium]|nr:16S rRNA processing protein RimM [Clostridia bacterium]
MKLIRIGKIVNTQGLKGDVRIYPDTDYVERFEELDYLYIENESEPLKISSVRYKKNLAIVKFKGLDHINDVEKYKNRIVYTEKLDYDDLEEDRYYVEDLIGLKVVDAVQGEIGILIDILQNPAHDLYVVKTKDKEVMIPAVQEFIQDVDLENKILHVTLIEGLL